MTIYNKIAHKTESSVPVIEAKGGLASLFDEEQTSVVPGKENPTDNVHKLS